MGRRSGLVWWDERRRDHPDLDEICDTLIVLAIKTGDVITRALAHTDSASSKKNSMPCVLETRYSKLIKGQRYPDFLLHEEETYRPVRPLTDASTFIFNPIDGTVNFVHGFPHAGVSLGLAINRVPCIGIVFNPFSHTLHLAIRGRGALLGRKTPLPLKLELSSLSTDQNSLIGVEWGSERTGNNWETKIRTFEKLGWDKENGGAMFRSMRSIGSAALNLCAVAAGTSDLYLEGGCWAWDVCAGWVILEEAGGIIVGGNPGEWEAVIDGRKYLAIGQQVRQARRTSSRNSWMSFRVA
ncbi:uncharacterized protein BDV14DRAFT_193962 [Aspergillus stella-maris]|uniref:uncharacterized protein n=1 Tax=Aspergillus stella-maris TaxID=1810926 RepID=UPI003CCDB3DB